MLRENVQNAYDAILIRDFRTPKSFDPLITITVTDREIKVSDNGVGMTPGEIRNNFWRAGASGKNTEEARSAGVVGTFGIGALANFGICQRLTVETESMTGERTKSLADRDSLSLDKDCILVERMTSRNMPGTLVTAELDSKTRIGVENAIEYLRPFVRHLPIPVKVNGISVSSRPLQEACPSDPHKWSKSFENRSAFGWNCNLMLTISENGVVWLNVTNIRLGGALIEGQVILKQGVGQIMTYRNSFGLARTGVSSIYSLGGVADLKILQPTAGRDALTIQSIQTLQSLVTAVEDMIGPIVAETDYADQNTDFMTWVQKRRRWELSGNLVANIVPSKQRLTLRQVSDLSKKTQVNSYSGYDETIVKTYASEDNPLIRISHSNPRAKCEEEYLVHFGNVIKISNEPQIVNIRADTSWTTAESALAFRLAQVLGTDYFVSVRVQFGTISHNLPLLLKANISPPVLILSSQNSSILTLLQFYETDLSAFGPFVKDFARNIVYPRISSLVPSSTREGAEGLLKILRRQRDTFEYELADTRRMEEVIAEFAKGSVSFTEVVNRVLATAQKHQQVVTVRDTQQAFSVIPDVLQFQDVLQKEESKFAETTASLFLPKPAIRRPDVETDAKLLMLDESQNPYGFKGLLRLSERAYSDKGEFFLQPHSTEVIWGGQRVIFIFRDVTGSFAFYYDVLLNELLSLPSGGKVFETMTIVLKNSVFIPIPSDLYQYFMPLESEKKKFDVRYDIIYPE